ncbi:unnamed protein product [Meganyctiphanes norvegica]|uniref:C2H2-type domain-containing protein n=1 Tax=Meganyctiphanes norvegica TaxID=48144 RepID=A0AAV2RZM0_MEGNR
MDTDGEPRKGEAATNTDQQTEKTEQLGRAREPGKRVPVLSEKMRENLALHIRKSQSNSDTEVMNNSSLPNKERSGDGEENRPKRPYRKRPHIIHLCKFCMKVCPTGEQLKEHQKTHETIECSFCGKILARIGAWETHLKVFHNVEIQVPGNEEALTRPKEELVCPECGKVFVSRPALAYHLRLHDGKSYPCEKCGKVFNHPSNLKTHKLRHEKKTFYCDKCGKGYHTNFALLMHDNQTHRLAKSWKCRYCGKAFTRCAAYKEHIRIHTGEKPFECNVCGVKFRKVHHLKTHAKQHEPKSFRGGPFKCQLCPNAIFLHKISYDRHRKYKHPDLDMNSLISCNENLFSNEVVLKEPLMISSGGQVGVATLIGSDEYPMMGDFQGVEGIEMVEGEGGSVGGAQGQCIIYLTENADVDSDANKSFMHHIEVDGQLQQVSQIVEDDIKPIIKTELLVKEVDTEEDLQLELNDNCHQVREFDDEQLEALQQMNDSALQQLSSGQLHQLSMSSLSGGKLQVQMPDGETFDVYTIAQ